MLQLRHHTGDHEPLYMISSLEVKDHQKDAPHVSWSEISSGAYSTLGCIVAGELFKQTMATTSKCFVVSIYLYVPQALLEFR